MLAPAGPLVALRRAKDDGLVKFIGVAGLGLPAVMPRLARAQSANGKLNVAFIATGGKGNQHVRTIGGFGENCPCFTDADKKAWGHVLERKEWSGATGFQDYRKNHPECGASSCPIN